MTKDARQGGIASHFQNSNPATLVFGGGNDAIDQARKVVQDAKDWLSFKHGSLSERYVHGEIDIVVESSAGADLGEYHLLFRSIPFGHHEGHWTAASANPNHLHSCSGDYVADGSQYGVLGICHAVHGPNGIIPSTVWLKGPKKGDDLDRDIFATSLDDRLKPGESLSDREIGVFGVADAVEDCGCIAGLVKRRSEVLNGILGDVGEIIGQARGHLVLVDLCDTVRIDIDDHSVWVRVSEGLDGGLKAPKVRASPCESLPWRLEWIQKHDVEAPEES